MKGFAYLDVEHPAVAWAAMRGWVISADQMPEQPSGLISFMLAGMLHAGNACRLQNELAIEQVRQEKFAACVSRIRGTYFFEDSSLASKAIEQQWGAHFLPENLAEFDLFPDAFSRLDANWITHAPTLPSGHLNPEQLNWIESYWSGAEFNDEPTWEIILNGAARIRTIDIRQRAYIRAKTLWPESLIPIEMAKMAGEVGSDGGLITPILIQQSKGWALGYCGFDGPFHEPETIQKLSKHPDFKQLAYLISNNETWKQPGFGPLGCEIPIAT